MKNYSKIYIAFIALSITISCDKILDVDVPENQINTNEVFENTQTADAALAALYAGLFENSPLSGDASGKLFSVYTDDADNYATTANNGVYELYQNTQIASNTAIASFWTNTYQQIYVANAIIQGIDNSTALPSATKSRIRNEALAIRSILFLYLTQIFGDIPYPTSTDYTFNKSLTKITENESLQKIAKDLLEASTNLQDAYRNSERIYVNKKTAQFFLAKTYMLLNQWPQAETILQEIAQSPLYNFQTDLSKVFQKSGTHILWQLKPKNSGDATKEVTTYYFSNTAPTNIALSQNLINSFQTNDLRINAWVASVTVGSNTWYRADKYKNRTANTTEYSIVLRLEEVYLSLAEVLAKQNKIPQALPYINPIKTRAGITTLSSTISQNNLITEIMTENRHEFFTEMGIRFFDLKRNNQLNSLTLTKPNWKSYQNLWPIPSKEITLNPNLKPQNNGY